MTTVGIIGFIAAIAVMIIGAYRGMKPITLTILASFVVILTNGMEIWPALARVPAFDEPLVRGGYAFGFGRAINSFFFLFVASSIYAVIMDRTGCTGSIGKQMVKWVGTKNVMVAVYFFTVILTYGGVNLFVVFFAALPIAYVMFKEANLPRALIMAPMGAGGAGITMTTLPGTPSLTNIIPGREEFLGTGMGSAPVFSLILAVIIVTLTLFYFRYAEKAARKNNEQFTFPVNFDASALTGEKADLPHPVLAFIPIVFLPLFILGSFALKAPYAADPIQLTVLAMVIGAVLCMALNFKKVNGAAFKQWTTDGASNGLMSLMALAAILGFGAVVQSAPAFQSVISWVMGLDLSVYFKALVSTGVISGIVGSSSGGAQIVMENLTPHFLAAVENGANIEVLHRILAMSAGTLDTLPHVSAIFVFLGVLSCSHKEAYKYLFWGTLVIPTFVTILAVISATIIW
ncbi:MAG: GntP family permease [Treponema sp.]|nr:GntP family permease [Treponema sp.]